MVYFGSLLATCITYDNILVITLDLVLLGIKFNLLYNIIHVIAINMLKCTLLSKFKFFCDTILQCSMCCSGVCYSVNVYNYFMCN